MSTPDTPRRTTAPTLTVIGAVVGVSLLVATANAGASWQEIAQFLSLRGKPEPASANVLSQHHTEALDGMLPQDQAEFLLEQSISHYAGANAEIEARLPSWRGKLAPGDRLERLFRMAINSDDLRVRAAGVEINILARKLEKDVATVDRLEPLARSAEQGPRANALWDLGLLGGRGVEPERVRQILLASIYDDNVNVRYWAVEGLAYLATDGTIEPLLRIFHDDASAMIRERAACNLAQSGMLNRSQRLTAVPVLLDYAADLSLDQQTRGWVFQALRDITGQNLPREAAAWRQWYDSQR